MNTPPQVSGHTSTQYKIATALAFLVGISSIVAGGMAIRGWEPGYLVLNWLPVYNFIMGVVTIFIPGLLIWRNHRQALLAALGTFSIHALVLLLLLFSFVGTVATQSILAMLFRLVVWVIILGLMIYTNRQRLITRDTDASNP